MCVTPIAFSTTCTLPNMLLRRQLVLRTSLLLLLFLLYWQRTTVKQQPNYNQTKSHSKIKDVYSDIRQKTRILGELLQDSNTWKTQRRDHTAIWRKEQWKKWWKGRWLKWWTRRSKLSLLVRQPFFRRDKRWLYCTARLAGAWPGSSEAHHSRPGDYIIVIIIIIIIIIINILYCTTLAKRRLLRRVRVKNRGWECSCVRGCVHVRVRVCVPTDMSWYIYMHAQGRVYNCSQNFHELEWEYKEWIWLNTGSRLNRVREKLYQWVPIWHSW